ncbi:MAG: acyl-CoA dehydratase activase-related protein [Eubacteriales bacterium]
MFKLGLDIGSTTIKCIVLDGEQNIVFSVYRRHFSRIAGEGGALLGEVARRFPGVLMTVTLSGSAGMGMAADLDLEFVQEVYATRTAVKKLDPDTDIVIELGGEDAKILFLSGGLEVRMNGTCAGGTGAFIDQIASLLEVSTDEMNSLASGHDKIYAIASRCGVFAKSDVQPLINQGARREDISASVFYAVVNQTIAGLAQGRDISGKVLYLGGPLTFLPELRKSFDDVLGADGICPENSLFYVAYGAALAPGGSPVNIAELSGKMTSYISSEGYGNCEPLFGSKDEYNEFSRRHFKNSLGIKEITSPNGEMYLGIDAGSTTVKALLCDRDGSVFFPFYSPTGGNPVPLIKKYLENLYRKHPDIRIASSAVTGYGEEIIKAAFHIDEGIVETIAHYTAAKAFCRDVDFIIDIGGQDIKCFKIHNGAIDNIFLNEACSSGCGSFLQTFAAALGYGVEEFAKIGLFAPSPVDLGSRCTVFMNSSVKQAQKDGATVESISAGLSISVVKNALYKVIRCASGSELGENIVVQGGTFHNDAVLRAFEKEIGRDVFRPKLSGVMGAYGAALYARDNSSRGETSGVLTSEKLASFSHDVKVVTCRACGNNCKLTVNRFSDGVKYIAGNRCEKPLQKGKSSVKYNMFEFKNNLLSGFKTLPRKEGAPVIGIPMVLNMYELLPFWAVFFRSLGFNVEVSPGSTRKLYLKGQHTIPSDTVCYPAKLVHGHIEELIAKGADAIFYPNMSYNIDESGGDNHYNCPVVAYYPLVIRSNIKALEKTKFICDFVGIHDKSAFTARIGKILSKYFPPFSKKEIKKAADAAYSAYDDFMAAISKKGSEFLEIAKAKNLPVIMLAGRPYHIDAEVCHGIDELICSYGAVVVTEDAIERKTRLNTAVLNQWTYHSRLYAAAEYVAQNPMGLDINLVQLVSFGCGVDAITTDEVRSIIEKSGKIYTQIKIDEITNVGAVKIRLRSLFSAVSVKKPQVGDTAETKEKVLVGAAGGN